MRNALVVGLMLAALAGSAIAGTAAAPLSSNAATQAVPEVAHSPVRDPLTLAVAAAAIAQALFAGWAILGLRHARRSADAAHQTLEEARITTQRQLRPYVGFKKAKCLQIQVGQPLRANIRVINSGQTPATEFSGMFNVGIFTDEKKEFVQDPFIGSRATIASGETGKFQPTGPVVTQDDIDRVSQETDCIYLWGRIEYQDGFGVTRYSTIRMQNKRPFDPNNPSFIYCREGSEAN